MRASPDMKTYKGIAADSRAIKAGYLFVALPGVKQDGRKFIADALRNGATGVLAPQGTEWPQDIAQGGTAFYTDANPRRALAVLAAEFYGRQPARIVAVTGTNGKTSTVHFCKQIWKALGYQAASMGTLGVRGPGFEKPGAMTTPDPVSLHAGLADLAAAGVTHLALEASSHGLDQFRLDGVKVSAAGFTNLTRDHLDYHPDMQDYARAKARLFSDLLIEGGTAVLNADDPQFLALKKICAKRGGFFKKSVRVFDYGRDAATFRIREAIRPAPQGLQVVLDYQGARETITLPLAGEFQAYNALCAAGLVLAESDDADMARRVFQALQTLQGPPGRLQLIPGHPRGAVYVDYAHTPDALENVLKALRAHTAGKLVCVFGCGGDRDPGKRPIMGKIAADLADSVIVTDDNPRSEKPASIRTAILAAAPGAREIGDRHEAIREVIQGLRDGDVLLIAGKGHEQGQIFADRTDPFDDAAEAAKAIQEL